ncbi:uncharacterized protein FTJAE_3234 [Fusarium tjaetaba]|uniref:DUF6546 domain-containing protein n=1 Tax=Fusarium tjaetaba TaxID=1567544 RepID=A0A8H5S0P0_9HYPO|nr:uncharacterized protein FTJAE_3234 [Fusarium tjaetaba]KAF5643434.1 hypothetical protein FTJAE_3234 [Fusarium tjaetaba]
MRWYSLYAGARLEILDFVVHSTIQEKGSIAQYACVSREWQEWFEIFTFKRLEISPSDIMPFITVFMNLRRRRYLQYIGAKLDLPVHEHIQDPFLDRDEFVNIHQQMQALSQQDPMLCCNYSWLRYKHQEDMSWLKHREENSWLKHQDEENNRAFTNVLRGLFAELFQWRREHCHHEGIELEIIADTKSHWQKTAEECQALNPPSDNGSGDFHNSLSSELQIFHAPPYHGHQVLHDGELDFSFWLELDVQFGGTLGPEVHVISGLSILRRSVRHFDPEFIAHIVSLLPRLRELRWEVRPHAHWRTEHKFHSQLQKLLKTLNPAMTKVRIQQQPTSKPLHSPSPSMDRPSLGDRLILSCPFLVNIYMDIKVDITKFFYMRNHLQNVRIMCVRTHQALLDELPNTSNVLFGGIAKAVSKMPKLSALCVFNKTDTEACAVNFVVERDSFKVIAHCSWPFNVRDETKARWRKAGRHQPGNLVWLAAQSSYDTVKHEIMLQQQWHSSFC